MNVVDIGYFAGAALFTWALRRHRCFETPSSSSPASIDGIVKAEGAAPSDMTKAVVSSLGAIPHPEGGYFIETYRSGSVPMQSRGLTDEAGKVIPTDREGSLRNQMTSMIFVGTRDAPKLYFGVNKSDHVHYFHGGNSYTYIMVLPDGSVEQVTLGGDLSRGEKLQIVFPAGCYKAGYLNGDYCVIGEGVSPGFDFRDFAFVDEDALRARLSQRDGWEQALEKYVEFVKPDRRRNFNDYYAK